MALRPATRCKKGVAKKNGKGVIKKAKKGVAKKAKKSVAKRLKKSVAKEPEKGVAKEPKKSVESSGWKKPASKRNLDPSGPLLRSKCHFFKLPLELRFMIYSDLVKSGSLEFLRSCQRIHDEALEITYRDGIYMVKEYGIPDNFMYVYGGQLEGTQKREPIGDKFQNVEISTSLSNFINPSKAYDGVDYLGDHYPELKNPEISRKDCWMRLWGRRGELDKPHLEERLAIMLRALRAFDNVFLNIEVSYKFHESENWFEILGNPLEPSFGPSTLHANPNKDYKYWEFHPRREV